MMLRFYMHSVPRGEARSADSHIADREYLAP